MAALKTQSLAVHNQKMPQLNSGGKSAKFSIRVLQTVKLPEGCEGWPKKLPFASHGDFRRYLYEAPIFTMPVSRGHIKQAQSKRILANGAFYYI
jgi:hypothetical protein